MFSTKWLNTSSVHAYGTCYIITTFSGLPYFVALFSSSSKKLPNLSNDNAFIFLPFEVSSTFVSIAKIGCKGDATSCFEPWLGFSIHTQLGDETSPHY